MMYHQHHHLVLYFGTQTMHFHNDQNDDDDDDDDDINANPIDTDTGNTSTGTDTDTGTDDTSKLTDIKNNIITDRGFAINFPENFKQKLMSLQISGSAYAGSGCSLSRKYGFFYIHNLKVGLKFF